MNLSYTKSTGQAHKIKVQSTLIYALWDCGVAYADSQVPFNVRTSLVGSGAEIKAKLKDNKGKTYTKKKDKIYGNYYRGTIEIPDNVRLDTMLYLEVELPGQSLRGESNEIPAGPIIKLQSMNWSQTEVKRLDVVKMQAQFIDLPDKTEATVTIYEYDEAGNNDPIASIPIEINGNRMEVLWEYEYHEDTANIPTQGDVQPYNAEYKNLEYFFVVDIQGTKIGKDQESGLMRFKDWIEIEVLDSERNPSPNVEYTIKLPDGSEQNVSTDANGILRIEAAKPGGVEIIKRS